MWESRQLELAGWSIMINKHEIELDGEGNKILYVSPIGILQYKCKRCGLFVSTHSDRDNYGDGCNG